MYDTELIRKMSGIVDYLWIVPSTLDLRQNVSAREDDFTFIDLSKNFRNSREIVEMVKSYAEENNYDYKKGIVTPLENFPTGCKPKYVGSIEDAMKEARKQTKDGILVIFNYDFDIFNQIKEKCKVYGEDRNDFKENENPYKFLQEGNVVAIHGLTCLGFEWATVIVFEGKGLTSTYHPCNFMMRCTTNLIVVKEK